MWEKHEFGSNSKPNLQTQLIWDQEKCHFLIQKKKKKGNLESWKLQLSDWVYLRVTSCHSQPLHLSKHFIPQSLKHVGLLGLVGSADDLLCSSTALSVILLAFGQRAWNQISIKKKIKSNQSKLPCGHQIWSSDCRRPAPHSLPALSSIGGPYCMSSMGRVNSASGAVIDSRTPPEPPRLSAVSVALLWLS